MPASAATSAGTMVEARSERTPTIPSAAMKLARRQEGAEGDRPESSTRAVSLTPDKSGGAPRVPTSWCVANAGVAGGAKGECAFAARGSKGEQSPS